MKKTALYFIRMISACIISNLIASASFAQVQCQADFVYVTEQIPSTRVAFFDISTSTSGNINSWLWTFGDGSTSTSRHPNHTYTLPGNYTVCLTGSSLNPACTSTTCDTIAVTGQASACGVSIIYNSNGNTVSFSISPAGPYDEVLWFFGDGTSSTLQNPVHTYASGGAYLVYLIVNNIGVCSEGYADIILAGGGSACQSDFTFTMNPVTNECSFTGGVLQSGNPVNYSWDFGDGTTSTLQNPVHTFAPDANFNVCLTMEDAITGCISTWCVMISTISNFFPVTCSSNFALYPDTVIAHNYFLVNLATGAWPISYTWTWGDGSTSTGPYPSHTYSQGGLYTICCSITDASGCTSSTCYPFQLLRLSSTSAPVTINVIPGPTGISEDNERLGLNIYPNPTSGIFTVEFSLDQAEKVNFSLLNTMGQKIREVASHNLDAGDHNFIIDASSLDKGIYFLEIEINEIKTYSKVLLQ